MTDARRGFWKSAYYASAERFADILFPICYTALAYKRAGGGVDFDRVKLEDLVTISQSGEVQRHARGTPQNYSMVFLGTKPSSAEVRAARLALKDADPKLWLRGKFAIWFSMTFFSRMKAVLGRKTEPSRAVVRASFNAETAITCLCGRASIPLSFKGFLRGWATSIVRDGVVPTGAVT
jgi:hypothetical protein